MKMNQQKNETKPQQELFATFSNYKFHSLYCSPKIFADLIKT